MQSYEVLLLNKKGRLKFKTPRDQIVRRTRSLNDPHHALTPLQLETLFWGQHYLDLV